MRLSPFDYFETLWTERSKATPLEIRAVQFRNGEFPERGQCHVNVDRWIAENPQHQPVRGWLIMNYGFERHSVVRWDTSGLVDITLPTAYRFLPHPGDETSFRSFNDLGCNQVFWPPPDRSIPPLIWPLS